MSDQITRVEIHATLLDVTYDEWDYIKDALGTLLTMSAFAKSDVTVERAPEEREVSGE